jgi:hypothetical protein
MDCFVACAPRNDGTIFAHPATGRTASHFKQPAVYRHGFAISPRVCARGLPEVLAPENSEGAGNAGRAMRPQPRMQLKKAYEHSHHGHTGTTRHSPGNGFTVSFVLFPVTTLV